MPLRPPIVLGHEGAGIVAQVGPGITDLQVGDSAVLSFNANCGLCEECSRGRAQLCLTGMQKMRVRMKDKDGKDMRQMGIGCMAEYTVVDRPSGGCSISWDWNRFTLALARARAASP